MKRSYLVNLLPALEVLGANHSMVMQQCLKINPSSFGFKIKN
jgi:hypothetical protein